MAVDAVIFDYGKVLSLDQDASDWEAMKRISGLDGATFHGLYWKHRDAYDAGLMSGGSYWEIIAREAGVVLDPDRIARLIEIDARSWSHTNGLALAWARELAASGLKTGILSNMHRDLRDYLEERSDWVGSFDCRVFSCDVGMVKPEAAIYRLIVNGLGVEPERALFLDDRRPNIEAATAAGLLGIVVHGVPQAMREASMLYGLPVRSLAGAA